MLINWSCCGGLANPTTSGVLVDTSVLKRQYGIMSGTYTNIDEPSRGGEVVL